MNYIKLWHYNYEYISGHNHVWQFTYVKTEVMIDLDLVQFEV